MSFNAAEPTHLASVTTDGVTTDILGLRSLLSPTRIVGIALVLAVVALTVATAVRAKEALTTARLATARLDKLQAVLHSTVDLRASTMQPIAGGLFAADLKVAQEPGGARISGLVINATSVTVRDASFSVQTRGDSATAFVELLPPGGSARFAVVVAGVSADSVRYGTIQSRGSTISYRPPTA